MTFFECELAKEATVYAVGGPSWSTTINPGFSGWEQRNQNWQFSLSKWELAYNAKTAAYFENLYTFWLNVGGAAGAFRFLDHKDFTASNQLIGLGDGATKIYQLAKTYTLQSRSYVRTIKKPITAAVERFDGTFCPDTVAVFVNGVVKTAGVDYTLDYTTGLVTFAVAPALGLPIKWTGQYHYPARFAMDDFKASVDVPPGGAQGLVISWPSVQVVEVRIP